jgi:hypothetical protein
LYDHELLFVSAYFYTFLPLFQLVYASGHSFGILFHMQWAPGKIDRWQWPGKNRKSNSHANALDTAQKIP